LKSMLYYRTGDFDIKNIFKSPASLRIKGNEISELQDTIDKSLSAGRIIYTDCLGPRPISRASIIEGNSNVEFFKNYEAKEIKSWESIAGKKSVYKLVKKL
jgi:hypothetical protein